MNCLSVFDHFVELVLKGLIETKLISAAFLRFATSPPSKIKNWAIAQENGTKSADKLGIFNIGSF